MKTSAYFLSVIFLFIGHFADAQISLKGSAYAIKGKGYNEEFVPIIAATISLKGSDCTATCDFDGRFSLWCPDTTPSSPIVLEIRHKGIKGAYKKFKPIEIVLTEELDYYAYKEIKIELIKGKKCKVIVE